MQKYESFHLINIGHNPDKVTASKDSDEEDQYGGDLLVPLLPVARLLIDSPRLADSFEEKIIEDGEQYEGN